MRVAKVWRMHRSSKQEDQPDNGNGGQKKEEEV